LIYDNLDRVQEEDDAYSQTVLYGHDPLGRVTTITYPGNVTLTNFYDPLGRLTNQVDWAGRQMSYGYDLADRLRTRRYPNGVAQTNGYDDAGRLTDLSYISPQISTNTPVQIALSYAYDRNGNKVGNSERGTFAWPMPSLVDETSRFTAAGRITNRVDALSPTNNFTYQYDASGNMTNAFGGGQSWKLAYDEDNRVTALSWDCGLTHKDITNRYDALGRRIARKVDGVETRYVLDLSGGMERILCDTTASGQITAWYIHGPDLCYRVDASNNIICYHADAQANIVALTDGGGTNVAQYAYTPYGRSLGSTNFSPSTINSQPYTFVGSQGVMEELPGLYFMRARYYSADAGIFLSTDSVRKIGPGWKPVTYAYANGNPLHFVDSSGKEGIDPLFIFDAADIIYKSANGQSSYLEIAAYGAGAVGTIAITAAAAAASAPVWVPAVALGLGVISLTSGANGYAEDWKENRGLIGGPIKSGLVSLANLPLEPNSTPAMTYNGRSIMNDQIPSLFASGGNITSAGQPQVFSQQSASKNVSTIGGGGISAGSTSGGSPSGNKSLVNQTVNSFSVTSTMNSFQSIAPAPASNIAGTTPMVSSSVSSGGNRSGSTATSTQITSSSTSFLGQVGGFISNVATSIGNFFGGLFGGGHR
jgi:RHS repeat-associated protein